jgi:putative FmdB family regulatory protein
MPLYEYQCDACEHRFEVIQKYSDAPITICPVCGGAVTKLFSSPAIQFKGSGWYITDYARAGKSDGESAPASKSDAKTESTAPGGESTPAKTDAKTETSEKPAKTESKSEGKSDAKPASPTRAAS